MVLVSQGYQCPGSRSMFARKAEQYRREKERGREMEEEEVYRYLNNLQTTVSKGRMMPCLG